MAKNNRIFFYAIGINKNDIKYIKVPELLKSDISFAALANLCSKPSSRNKDFKDAFNLLTTNKNWKLYDNMPPLKELDDIAFCRKCLRNPELKPITTKTPKNIILKSEPFWGHNKRFPNTEILQLLEQTIENQKQLEAYYTPSIYEQESYNLMKNYDYPCDPSCGKDAIFVNKFKNFIASDIDEKICNSTIIHRDLSYYIDHPPIQCDCYYTNPPFSKIQMLLEMAEKQRKVIGLYMPVYKLPKRSMPCIGGFLMWSQIEWSLTFKFLLGFFVFDFKNNKCIDNIELPYLPTNEKFLVEFSPPNDSYQFQNCIKGPQRFFEDGWNNLRDSPFYGKVVYKNKLFRKYTGQFIKEKFIQECQKPEYQKYLSKIGNNGGGKNKNLN